MRIVNGTNVFFIIFKFYEWIILYTVHVYDFTKYNMYMVL